MRALPAFLAIAAAVAVATVGFVRGTYAAGGSDSSCYALMAEAFAAAKLQPTSDLAVQVPWPDASKTFTPGGFVPSQEHPSASSPICAPGFSLLLALFAAAGGLNTIFLVTPLAAGVLVWLAFVAARALGGPLAGASAALLVAASPIVLYQVVQPMNDVTTAALWMAVYVALISRRWAIAGVCCGVALLVRPNLLPFAIVSGMFVIAGRNQATVNGARASAPRPLIARLTAFGIGALPFGLLVLWLNHALYGSALRTGYGQLDALFSLTAASANAPRYLAWLVETHTPFPLLALAAPFLVAGEKRIDAVLALGLIMATWITYLFYTPFDDWSYLRFLLPAVALMIVLASTAAVQIIGHMTSGSRLTASVVALSLVLAAVCVRTAHDRLAFNLQFLEQRYRSAGVVVRDRLPAGAVVLSVWDSGAVRFHGRKEALAWESLDPAWLDRSLQWLEERGRTPYLLVESWEEPAFRARFSRHSAVGKLDWPPRYEIDRVVRIYDPRDRLRHDRGEHVQTEYLWPLRN